MTRILQPGQATVIRAKGFVEIHQFGANKSVAVGLILDYLKENIGIPDFALYAGDDESDELAFKGELMTCILTHSCDALQLMSPTIKL